MKIKDLTIYDLEGNELRSGEVFEIIRDRKIPFEPDLVKVSIYCEGGDIISFDCKPNTYTDELLKIEIPKNIQNALQQGD